MTLKLFKSGCVVRFLVHFYKFKFLERTATIATTIDREFTLQVQYLEN
jgi:hypothetical protein